MVRVNLDSIEVRFDGYTVKTHMSRRFQEQQCGLCGHFDGEVRLYRNSFEKNARL